MIVLRLQASPMRVQIDLERLESWPGNSLSAASLRWRVIDAWYFAFRRWGRR